MNSFLLINVFIISMFFLVGCNKNIDDQYLQEGNNEYIENEDNSLEKNSYRDGTYCGEVEYYNPTTGTRKIYDLNVEVENGLLTIIHWPNNGWLDNTHFSPKDINDGECEFISDKGCRYKVVLGETGGCSFTDEFKIRRDVNNHIETAICLRCGDDNKESYEDYCYSCKKKIEDEEENTCSKCGNFEYGVYGELCTSCKGEE
jgi:hypothetical protein